MAVRRASPRHTCTLPDGFDNTVWGTASGLYPYLSAFGVITPDQKISGYAYHADGSGAEAASVGVYQGGSLLTGSSATSGSNGYYYILVPANTADASSKLGAALTLIGDTGISGVTYTDAPTLNNTGDVTDLDVTSGQFAIYTHDTSVSAMAASTLATFGNLALSSLANVPINEKIVAAADFTVDGTLTSPLGSLLLQAGGDITMADGASISSTATGNAITIAADGAFINQAGANALNAANGNWLIYTQAHGDATARATSNDFGGLVGKSWYNDAFDFTAGTLAATPNSGNRFVTGYAPVLSVMPNSQSLAYTGAVQTTGYGIGGYVSDDDALNDTLGGSVSGLTSSGKDVGTYNLTASGTLTSDENYGFQYGTGTLTITPMVLTLGLTGTVEKTYDATDAATLALNNYSGLGFVNGDHVSLTGYATGSYDSRNAGTGKTVSVSGLTLAGTDAGNYQLTTASVSGGVGVIDKAALTLAAVTDSKTYDASTASTGTVGVSGLQGSDTVTGATQSFDSKNAGSRTLTVGGYTINDGNSGGNYTVSTTTASGTISKAALTLAAVTDSKTYDASTASTGTVGVSGLQGSDTVTGATQSFDSKNAGSRTLTVGGYTINDGNSGGNYTVSTTTASGTISKAALTLAAVTDSKTYDATTASTGTVGVSGLQGSDTVTGATQSFDSKNAGSRTLSVNSGYTLSDGNSGGNYTVSTTTAAGTIDKAALTLAAVTDSKTYDANTASTGTVGISGLQGSDTVSGAAQSFDSKNAGSRTLSVGGYTINDGNSGGNYTVSTTTAAGTISKAALTLAAVTDSKTYDASTASTGTVGVSGLQGSDTVTGATQSFDSKNAGSRTLSVGGYTINDGNSGGNYTVSTTTASGTISKAALTASLTGTVTKTYDATTDAQLTDANYIVSGVISGDDAALNDPVAGTYADQNVGTGKTVRVSGLALSGADAGNYTVNSSASAAIGTIDPRALSVTADTISKFAGAVDPALTWKITLGDLVGGDALTGGLNRDTGEDPGSYAIRQGSLAASANYKVTFKGATFSITPVALQNQPVVNPAQNIVAPPPPPPPPPTTSQNNPSGGDSGSGSTSGGGSDHAGGPTTDHGSSSSGTCVSGEACSSQPYPGNQSFSSYVSFLSH
ncbi:YDG domain-containing protein [Asticcacaulis sp. EMRT-3]|uniref:beta strand repeat-containing protein n=1 Tax=Asticcacaulis sp. EMRT-3 TaxID=3040349 RepID=UPI0024AEE38A|nr:YDG domain-containing protein [Asticcacaulis sp. EMRT-3]MDI7776391.1 YDG domain-containing protein [Asticcacaulis sp. EMRT-3]